MRKLDGTTPLACPEWAPAVSTSTVSSPLTRPRSDVASHSRSSSRQPPSRQIDELGLADAVGERLDVRRQVGAAALLAGLDEHDEAGVGDAGGLGALDGDEGGERGVPVVGAAAPVELVALDDRRPRPEALAPAGHLGLLVEVAVEQHGALGERRVGGRHLAHDERREAGEAVDVDGEPGDRAGRAPVADHRHGLAPCGRCASHAASNALDTLGMRMYSVSVGRTSSSQRASMRAARSVATVRHAVTWQTRGTGRAPPRRPSGTTSSPAGTRASMAPTPCPHGMNSRLQVDGLAAVVAEVVDAGAGGGDDLGRERLQLLGVLLEVLRPVVAHDAARLAREALGDHGAVLGEPDQRLLVAVDRAGLGRGDEARADPDAVGAERERGGEAAPVEEPAGGDDGHPLADGVDDLRDERHRRHGARCARRPRCPGRRRSRTRWRRR